MTPQFKKYNGLLFLMLDEPELKDGQLIIGYPVADGSKEWALWNVMNKKDICHGGSEDGIVVRHKTKRTVDQVWRIIKQFSNGWQIYEEEPQLRKTVEELLEAQEGER